MAVQERLSPHYQREGRPLWSLLGSLHIDLRDRLCRQHCGLQKLVRKGATGRVAVRFRKDLASCDYDLRLHFPGALCGMGCAEVQDDSGATADGHCDLVRLFGCNLHPRLVFVHLSVDRVSHQLDCHHHRHPSLRPGGVVQHVRGAEGGARPRHGHPVCRSDLRGALCLGDGTQVLLLPPCTVSPYRDNDIGINIGRRHSHR
mmetsp:Transcript_15391/g.39699  ORF Transcript_15391/g.39699 Transcript_15391/m.39699 type:complete len:202 (+) Transcript_15391:463-1068(+)